MTGRKPVVKRLTEAERARIAMVPPRDGSGDQVVAVEQILADADKAMAERHVDVCRMIREQVAPSEPVEELLRILADLRKKAST